MHGSKLSLTWKHVMIKIGQVNCAHFKCAAKDYDVLLSSMLMLVANICYCHTEYKKYVLHELSNC